MSDLVTVAQVNAALRLDLDADLADPSYDEGDTDRLEDVQLKITQATALVLDYITIAQADLTAQQASICQLACLMTIKAIYDNDFDLLRGLDGEGERGPVALTLKRLRDPTLA